VWRLFLELHDVSLTASSVDRVLIFENVAAGRISPDELAGWLRTHQRRL
jgi:prophage maintenance system killer protein